MTQSPFSGFAPSRRALEFGAKYAEVLEQWGVLFASASTVVRSSMELGEMATEAAEEFEQLLESTANGPFGMFNPETMQQFMRNMSGMAGGGGATDAPEDDR